MARLYLPFDHDVIDAQTHKMTRPWVNALNYLVQAITATPTLTPGTIVIADGPTSVESGNIGGDVSTSGGLITTLRRFPMMPEDSAGDDGGLTIPGPQGNAGPAGATGPAGPISPALDGDPGEDAQIIPGAIGPQGVPGATGPAGPISPALDGDPGEDALMIPGVPGPQGSGGGISGPGSSTDNAIVRWDGTAGTAIQNSTVTVADAIPSGSQATVLLDSVGSKDVVNDNTEQTMYSLSVPGNLLGSGAGGRRLKLDLVGTFKNNSGLTRTLTWKAKYGSTTLYEQAVSWNTSSVTVAYAFELLFGNVDATNAQFLYWHHVGGSRTNPTTGISSLNVTDVNITTGAGSAAEDSTGALTLAVTLTFSAADTNLEFVRKWATLQLI